jgi:hypothetical protein
VLLVEKSAYEADITKVSQPVKTSTKGGKSSIRVSKIYLKASKEYAIKHGVLRGGFGGESDAIAQCDESEDVPLDCECADEGLYTFVQTVHCRRRVLTQIYMNNEPSERI